MPSRRPRRHLLAGLTTALLLVGLWGVPAAAADLIDPATGTRFESEPTVDGTDFRCLGAGVRKVVLQNAYSVAYCVDAEQAEAVDDLVEIVYPNRSGTALRRTLEHDQDFFDAISGIPGDKLVILHLVRDLPQSSLADSFRAALDGRVPKDKIDALVKAIPGGGKRGDTALLYTQGSKVVISVGAGSATVEDDTLATHLPDVWLGPRSATPSLKTSIARVASSESQPVTASTAAGE